MTWQHDTMMNPPIEELLDRADSKFRLVTLGAKRARQINSYFGQLGDGPGTWSRRRSPRWPASRCRSPSRRSPPTRSRPSTSTPRPTPPRPRPPPDAAAADGRQLSPPTARDPSMLAGRRVVLGVTGGIAAYKAVEVCRRLVDAGAHVARS